MAQCSHCRAETPEDSTACVHCGSPVEKDELLGSEVLGRYRIVALLAEGGMGRVYRAEQSVGTVVRHVAIKVLRRQLGRDRQLMARFAREAETLVRLTHPNTVQLFDFGALPDGTLALVMEYVEGHSLAHTLAAGPLSVTRAERVLVHVCGALTEAHAHGIVHRDLKPENLLIAERVGHGEFIKVLDFGIAKVSAEETTASTKLTQQGMMIGTPPYMSPEQFSGEAIDARSDVYSLGVIAFELLTGKLPFAANTPWEWASKHLTTPPDELPLDTGRDLQPRHAFAIRRALAKRPLDRPQTVAEFLALFIGRETMPTLTSNGAVEPSRAPASSEHAVVATNAQDSGAMSRGRPAKALWVGLGVIVSLLAGGLLVVALSWSSTPSAPASQSVRPAALPAPAPVMPIGAAVPREEREPPASAPVRPDDKTSAPTAERTRSRRREHVSAPESQPSWTRVPAPAVTGTPEPSPKRAFTPLAAPVKAPAIAPELAERIAQIRLAASSRVETAVGLYQAASGKFGAAPALQSLRGELASAGERRLRELLEDGRCAQAQAIYRALRSIAAAPRTTELFGARCQTP